MKLMYFLSKEPIIGYASSFGSSLVLFISGIMPALQLLGCVVGIGVGVLTFYAKWLEIKNNKNSKNENP